MDDKRELLKLKQGLVAEHDSKIETESNTEKRVYPKPTGMKAVENFLYHYKLQIIFISFFTVVLIFLVYTTLSQENPDITVLFVADNEETAAFFRAEAATLQEAIELYTFDFNENGNIYARCLTIDLTTKFGNVNRNPEIVHGEKIKLFGEVLNGDSSIYVGNKEALEGIPEGAKIPIEDFYEELRPVKDSVLEEAAEFKNVPLPDDLYIALRKGTDEDSLTVWLNILEGATVIAD